MVGCGQAPEDEDLVDALAVEINHFEQVARLFGGFAFGGHMAEPAHEPTGEGLEVTSCFRTENDPGKGVFDSVEIDESIGKPRAVIAGKDGGAGPFALAGELADDGFHDVLEGDHADGDPEFVDDECDVLAGSLEEFDELKDGLVLVNGKGFDHEIGEPHGDTGGKVGVDGLDGDDACGLVPVAGVDGEIGVVADHDLVPDLIVGIILIEPDDLGSGGHDLADRESVEFEGLMDDLAFDAVEGTGTEAFLHEPTDFFF